MGNGTEDTKNRLLDAAEGLFAEGGFDGVSARDITKQAHCNVASINYYFTSKENLYNEVCRRRLNALRDIRMASIHKIMAADATEITLEDLFREFSYAFLSPLMEDPKGKAFLKLMTREMLYPHMPAGMCAEEMIIPVLMLLVEAVEKICPGLTRDQAMWSIYSLISQLVHAVNMKTIMGDCLKGMPVFDVNKAVNHIVSFTAAGVRSFENE